MSARAPAATRFTVPVGLPATEPPEARGVARDGVRLLVARRGHAALHRRFTDLPRVLSPGDLVVVNTSQTAPAAVDGCRADGRPVVLHVSGPVRDAAELFAVELRSVDGERVRDGRAGERIMLGTIATVDLLDGHPDPAVHLGSRLWRARLRTPEPVLRWLHRNGRPIGYSYLRGRWPLDAYTTIFARPDRPGEFPSAELPSAGRPFTPAVLAGLATRGVRLAELVLHTGVSSPEADETPLPERYRVPAATADAVNATHAEGGRVIAVGTTVTRALESAVDGAGPVRVGGRVRAGGGWTDLVLGPERPAVVVDGLVTGWHPPEASHLLLLEAVAGAELVGRAYAAALADRYRWHEFGDAALLLLRR